MEFTKVNINPFIRGEEFTSYDSNIGESFPSLYIDNTSIEISVYDGIMSVGSTEIYLQDYKIGELAELMTSLGVDIYVYRGFENIESIMLENFSNTDIVITKIDMSPLDLGLVKSKSILGSIVNKYSEDVTISSLDSNIRIINNKAYSEEELIGEYFSTLHFAKTFKMNILSKNIIRDYENISRIPGAYIALVDTNLEIAGRDNADYKI